MAKREWVGTYTLHVEDYLNYKSKWVEKWFDLGKCLGEDEACERAVACIMREFTTNKLRNIYIVNGWGQIICL